MAPTLRNKMNPFFARENHKKLARNQKNKMWVDTEGPLPADGSGSSEPPVEDGQLLYGPYSNVVAFP